VAPADRDLSKGHPEAPGSTLVCVSVDGVTAAAFWLNDKLKKDPAEMLHCLQQEGVRVVMLTGDREEAAHSIAQQLSIREFRAGAQPQDKAAYITELQKQGRKVAMAGDGINDAPALAAADVGIAMSTGTDVAIESAGITLLKGDLRGILRARKLSRATIRNIKQNLLFAFLYNALGIPIAAGILYPFFGWLLSPMIASAAMSFSSVSVIANALRLRSLKL
jgi:P-type E1-E2 ATPase